MAAVAAPAELSPAAHALLAGRPVFDAHVDSLQRALDLGEDLGVEGRGHLDLARGARGGLGAVVFACWPGPVGGSGGPGGARERVEALLGRLHELARRHPRAMRIAGNGPQLAEARRAGAVAGIAGIEGGHAIEDRVEHLERFFERGVRIMTLVWNDHLAWIRSCRGGAGPEVPRGLSGFGRDVVRRMNELGMVVDLSHAGERAFYDALEAGAGPPIASHSGCRALQDHPRNLDDRQLAALAEAGGVVGIPFAPAFLDAAAQAEDSRLREEEGYRSLEAENETALLQAQGEYLQGRARELSAERVVDHIVHAAEVCGAGGVGIGSDFDGIERRPAGLEDAGCYPVLAELLLRRGFEAGEVEMILGGNMERVFAAATGPGTRAFEAEPWGG